ncbi:hypothetical protein H4S14_003384 [Agrobacterium vitis]|nr:hypothetical protein [Agrobacterium vitis]MBE1439619.1 hypothetical protein [Agrobacterium vitis]
MNISFARKIMLTAIFTLTCLVLCLLAAKITGFSPSALVVAALLVWPFGWMVCQTWKDS